MNKTFRKIGTAIMGLALVAGLSTSCSNGDWEDSLQGGTGNGGNNGKITVSFAMQAPIRVITLGNDDDAVNTDDNAHQFKLQATWGGGYKNTKDCKISYKIDPSLLEEGSGMEVLPESYYTLEDPTTLTIPKGKIIGGTTVHLTDAFFNDPKAATTHYVLPVRLVSSLTGDSILEKKNYQMICVKYKNQYSGMYCKTGTTNIQDLKTITHKNEDALDVASTVDFNTSSITFSYPVKEWKYDDKEHIWSQIDASKELTITLAFNGENCQVLQDGKVIGNGTFAPRGIQDFSDKNRMADCLKIKFNATVVTNAGDAEHEKTWTISADYVMSMMSRGNKLESWK